jgi:hypothetical protein
MMALEIALLVESSITALNLASKRAFSNVGTMVTIELGLVMEELATLVSLIDELALVYTKPVRWHIFFFEAVVHE